MKGKHIIENLFFLFAVTAREQVDTYARKARKADWHVST